MQQYFIDQVLKEENEYLLPKNVIHHFNNVLKMRNGESFYLVDSQHIRYLCHYYNGYAKVFKQMNNNNELPIKVTIVQALIKNDKFDYFLMKSTELGVNQVVPLMTQRTIYKMNDKVDNKVQRWNKICFEASCQSKRNDVPIVKKPIKLNEIKQYLSDINLVAYEDQTYDMPKLKTYIKNNQSITIVIGPEGGFDSKEIAYLIENDFKLVSLGKRILRAETAGLYVLSVIDSVVE